MKGAGISDHALLEEFDLRRAGLEEVRESLKRREIGETKIALARYLRDRRTPRWFFDWRNPPVFQAPASAERYLRGEVRSVGVWHRFGNEIDWLADPIDYREFTWGLNRHYHWVEMGKAYRATGNEEYAREFVHQLRHWVQSCPVPEERGDGTLDAWRSIEAGIRMGQTWPEAFFLFLPSENFDSESIFLFLKSIYEHSEYLMKFESRGNWLTMEASGLLTSAVLFPEFRKSTIWLETASCRLYKHLDLQVYPDGAQKELTPGYHCVSLRNFLTAWRLARLNDVELPVDYLSKLERMFEYLMYVAMPNGSAPGLNDSSDVDVREILGEGFELFQNRQDFLYVSTDGRKGERPEHNSHGFPYAGYFVMRSGWHKNDRYFLFDGGPFGLAHQHEDKLNFVLYACGKVLLYDPGNYAYDNSVWRKHFTSSFAHNVILVDGNGQNRRPRAETHIATSPCEVKWHSELTYDYAEASYDEGFGEENEISVTHTRKVLFVKPDIWVVIDLLSPPLQEEHTYELLLHTNSRNIEVGGGFVTCDKGEANLQIVPLAPVELDVVSGELSPYLLGWRQCGERKVTPFPVCVMRKTAVGETFFAYVLVPLDVDESPKRLDVSPIHMREDGLTVAFRLNAPDGSRFYFVHNALSGGGDEYDKTSFVVTCGEFTTDAEVAFAEINPDGKPGRVAVVSGDINWLTH